MITNKIFHFQDQNLIFHYAVSEIFLQNFSQKMKNGHL